MPDIIFDCCVVSNFAISGALRVIRDLYGSSAWITGFVAAEILRGIQSGHGDLKSMPEAVRAGWLTQTDLNSPEERELFASLSVSLGLGEASSIAVAKCRGYRLASDDWAARREARALGIKLTGTIGILRRAVELRFCDLRTASRYLEKMVAAGFYSPGKSLLR
jgi:predicted nucleic acid-binding protein